MMRLRAIALAVVLVAFTATAEAQIFVYSSHTATMVVSASQQVDIRLTGGCNSNRVVQVVLAAVMTGYYDNGYGLATATRNGAPITCRGTQGTFTVSVSMPRDAVLNLRKLRLEAKGVTDIAGVPAVVVTSADAAFDGSHIPLETRIVW